MGGVVDVNVNVNENSKVKMNGGLIRLWTVLDCSKLNEATGWQCLHSIEDGIEELWDHLISQIEEKAA